MGPAFAERVEALGLRNVTVESNYQLNIEDAELISRYDVVVFADAAVDVAEPFEFKPLEAKPPLIGFSSHSVSAESLLGLASELFGSTPRACAVAIHGYEFEEFGERLSGRAAENLTAAVNYFESWARLQ